MINIIDLFKLNATVKSFKTTIETNAYGLLVNNSTPNHHYLMAYLAFLETDQSIVYVASNLYKATLAYEALCQIAGFDDVHFYVVDEVAFSELLAVSHEFKFERIYAVNAMLKQSKKIYVTHVNAVVRPVMPPSWMSHSVIHFATGQTIDRNQIIEQLIHLGYRRAPLTTVVGEFSVRGEVIDIFPINRQKPIRIDLFDQEIDYIKTFDPETQKTDMSLDFADVLFINELVYDNPQAIVDAIRSDTTDQGYSIQSDLEDIIHYRNCEKAHKYIRYFSDEVVSILDYLDEKIVFYEEVKRIEEKYDSMVYELHGYLETQKKTLPSKTIFILDQSTLYDNVNKKIYLSEFRQSHHKISLTQMLDLDGYSVIDYQNDIKNWVMDLKLHQKTVVIACATKNTLGLVSEILRSNEVVFHIAYTMKDLKSHKINVIESDNAVSFGMMEGIEVISEANIFKKMKLKQTKYRSAYQNTTPIYSKDDIKPGEYVVHYDYGIGQYKGIKTIELQDVKNDYIVLGFDNMELYIPVENINLLEKYQGTEGSIPKLSSIGGNDWEKKKKKVKEKLESIAKELILTQAARENRQGFIYEKDDDIQHDFEIDFEFIETKDQLKTIETIKEDMEKGWIVDRLVCGDVGYGKTEVAMRAALKTVLSGKQVAYLAPTTILTRQHYYSFKDRFEKYGIRVELLNRFVSELHQKDVIKDLQSGQVDIVIGTHKLLNDEIRYKDLGLLIVDEEQRFGVTHKEKIKQYKNTINVITLTATPIPRTLQMAMMGVRQLSLIETPPQNRYPVQTYVLEENDVIVREAIYREISRGGQVFYLHNRISDLEKVYRKIKRLVPDAKILIAHGKMEKEQLEDAMQAFIDKTFDVLLCTTIIETGIDIPNTNTLIVDMADRLGLAQMYQIRGRVGRSDRVSYAYFMFDEDKVLTDAGAKRLQAIKEFTTLGSGYKIAVRDLAIRGAGDILGREQSGFIDSIGLDMYMKLLNEAIDEAKGIIPTVKTKKAWDVEISKHVDNQYVSDDDIKIYIHKKISKIETREERDQLIIELTDRFGRINDEIRLYIDKQYMESLLELLLIEDVKEKPTQAIVRFSETTSKTIDGKYLFQKAYDVSQDITFEYKNKKILMYVQKRIKDKSWIQKVIRLLEFIKQEERT